MLRKYFIIAAALVIHFFFYYSALSTHTLDYFFPWGNVHELQGLDFYQVPNGAYAYLHGGNLSGEMPAGKTPYSFGNRNVYHPFFTLLIGILLQLATPKLAFRIWLLIHALITLSLATILLLRFRKNKFIALAIYISLAFFPHYLEIWNGQYQFLLDTAVFFLLLTDSSLAYTASLLVKPVGLLWIPSFILKKRWRTLITSTVIFTLLTLYFIIDKSGTYYLQNLFDRIRSPIGGPPGVFTLDSLLRFWQIPFYRPFAVKIVAALAIFILQIKLRLNLFQSLFLWTSYYLLFYDLVFEYHYTTLFPFLAIGILTQKTFQNTFSIILALSFTLPTPFFLMHFLQIGAIGHKVTDGGWSLLVLFRILPLILLNFHLLYRQWALNLSRVSQH